MESAKSRFLRYVTYYTTSDEFTGTSPSTERQKDLGRVLMQELEALKLEDVHMDDCGNVLATLPASEGVDAVLVQDWGLLTLAKEIVPDLPLHASTQMSLFTLGGANAAAALGMERVVLARELDRDEVREICAGCGAEIEVFGHGALCMCYSGQCEMSAVLGQRLSLMHISEPTRH